MDRRKHKSPNSAQTEAACAGALGVRLAGDASYFGTLVRKPTIGEAERPIRPEDIPAAHRLMYGTEVLCLALCAAAAVLCSHLSLIHIWITLFTSGSSLRRRILS